MPAISEIDPFQELIFRANDLKGIGVVLPIQSGPRYHHAKLQLVRATVIPHARRKGLHPLPAVARPALPAKVVPRIAGGREDHFLLPLRGDPDSGLPDRKGAFQQVAAQRYPVRYTDHRFTPAVARRHRLRIVEVWIDEVEM